MNEIESECCYLFPTYKLKQSWFVRSYLLNFLWTYTPYDIVKVVHLSTKKKQPPRGRVSFYIVHVLGVYCDRSCDKK